MGKTLRQMALTELWNATDEYCAAQNLLDKTRFVAASLRLHIARGGDIPRSAVRASNQQIKATTPYACGE